TFGPDSTIAELVIMKMISSTRKMSVSGVMLISATMPSPSPPSFSGNLPSATFPPEGTDAVDEACDADAHGRAEIVEAHLKVVVGRDRDDRDAEAARGRRRRLRDARRDHREAAGAGLGHVVERAHDADHRAEQADERRRAADRADQPDVAAQRLRLLDAVA